MQRPPSLAAPMTNLEGARLGFGQTDKKRIIRESQRVPAKSIAADLSAGVSTSRTSLAPIIEHILLCVSLREETSPCGTVLLRSPTRCLDQR